MAAALPKLRDVPERGKRRSTQRIYIEVPGAKLSDIQQFPASFTNACRCRDYNLLDCVMKTPTVLRV